MNFIFRTIKINWGESLTTKRFELKDKRLKFLHTQHDSLLALPIEYFQDIMSEGLISNIPVQHERVSMSQ